jgi:CheY-like chemotaxis protein
MMQGSIRVDSEYKKGSTFIFNIVLQKKKSIRKKEKTKVIEVGKDIPRKSILIVDDNAINRKVAEMTIARLGHDTACAINGHEAYQSYLDNSYDLILMDVHMPELDGLETTALIRKYEKDRNTLPIPIIAMTAAAMKGDRERFLEAGMTEYISKPFKIEDIKKVLFSLFG